MAIPKVIYQTFKTKDIPFITRLYIWFFRKRNPQYQYEFYDDDEVSRFIRREFPDRIYQAYSRLQIGAAKADFFRYAILLKKGGVYLDLDSDIISQLHLFIEPEDVAVITRERNHQNLFAQWGLIYAPNHPFLVRTLAYVVENIEANAFPHDVHAMTGPTVYTRAIEDCLRDDPNIPHRVVPDDYKGMMKFKYKFGKFFIYKNRANHWKKRQLHVPVVRPPANH